MLSPTASNRHSLATGLVKMDQLVLTWAVLTSPSFPGKVWITRPIGQFFRGGVLSHDERNISDLQISFWGQPFPAQLQNR